MKVKILASKSPSMMAVKKIKPFKYKSQARVTQKRALTKLNKVGLTGDQTRIMDNYWKQLQSNPVKAMGYMKDNIAQGKITPKQATKAQTLHIARTPNSQLIGRSIKDIMTGKQRTMEDTKVTIDGNKYSLKAAMDNPILADKLGASMKLKADQRTKAGISAVVASIAGPYLDSENKKSAALAENLERFYQFDSGVEDSQTKGVE